MPNKSHFNSGHRTLNQQAREGLLHSSTVIFEKPDQVKVSLFTMDCLELLRKIPSDSVQLVLVDPPYNLDLASWDEFSDYISWAKEWIKEAYRVLSPSGNLVIFGGMQYQGEKSGDLLEISHYIRHNTNFLLVNMIIWYYKNGMSAHRFFANRHEEIFWYAKTKKYYFDLDSVRIPFDRETMELYLRDKRLNPDNVVKGKNPTNVWEIGRLNGNSLERVGHETQKPIEIVRRLVKSLSYPGSIVLDFFAGSGTTGRVCIEEMRNCIMCDQDEKTHGYFQQHLANMSLSQSPPTYILNASLDEQFFV